MVLPLRFQSLVVAFCHIEHLCYGCTTLATAAWQAMGLVYTYIVHIIPEFAEEGCTATLCIHGWSYPWFNPRTPMPYSDEAGERDLRVAKRYAPVTCTRQDASISESLKHELYEKFAANALWQTVFQRVLRHLMTCQEVCGLCVWELWLQAWYRSMG